MASSIRSFMIKSQPLARKMFFLLSVLRRQTLSPSNNTGLISMQEVSMGDRTNRALISLTLFASFAFLRFRRLHLNYNFACLSTCVQFN